VDYERARPRPFEHVHARKEALYRAVMRIFVSAKRRFRVHLRPEDLLEALQHPIPRDELEAALSSQADWGNLRADLDTSRVTTVQDFYRPRHLNQLTREREAAELALETCGQALGSRGELPSVALEDIRVRLHSLLHLARARTRTRPSCTAG